METGVIGQCSARRGLVFGAVLVLVVVWVGACSGRSPAEHIHQLKSMRKVERTKAANELIRFDADAVVPLLIDEADSGYIRVRFEVVNLLGRFKDERAVPALMAALKDKSPRVAAMAAWALGRVRSPGGLPALLKYTRDPTVEVRQYVLGALGPCHDYELEPALSDSGYRVVRRALAARKPKWRIAALQSLREYGYRDAAEDVIRLTSDPSAEVRHVAIQALGQIGSGQHAPPAPKDPIAPVGDELREEIYQALLVALDPDELQSIRIKAIRALVQVRDLRAIPPIERRAREGTNEERLEARRALDKLNPQPVAKR